MLAYSHFFRIFAKTLCTKMKHFWKTRQFWRNIALMIGASLLIMLLTLMSLKLFTRHGQSFIVPDFTGLSLNHLGSLHDKYGFKFIVVDSVFDQTQPPGTVLRHDPEPGATVKRGRKFYITLVSSMPDMVAVPNLVDLSLRQATALLESRGLFVGNITYQPGQFQNAVLGQSFRGQTIFPGEQIRKGSYINLVVSGSPQNTFRGDADNSETDVNNDEILTAAASVMPDVFSENTRFVKSKKNV